MFTTRKMIDSVSPWLLAAFILPLCLAIPAPCAAASSADLAARANHLLLPSNEPRRRPAGHLHPEAPASAASREGLRWQRR